MMRHLFCRLGDGKPGSTKQEDELMQLCSDCTSDGTTGIADAKRERADVLHDPRRPEREKGEEDTGTASEQPPLRSGGDA